MLPSNLFTSFKVIIAVVMHIEIWIVLTGQLVTNMLCYMIYTVHESFLSRMKILNMKDTIQ